MLEAWASTMFALPCTEHVSVCHAAGGTQSKPVQYWNYGKSFNVVKGWDTVPHPDVFILNGSGSNPKICLIIVIKIINLFQK